MSLESYCAACTYLGERADYSGKYWCSSKGENHYASDPKCYSFCEAYSRSNSARENMYSNSASHSGGGCYITTMVCEILGYKDNNYYLQTLRNFRDNKMKPNINYIPLLMTYDVVGPKIANNLKYDYNNKDLANYFFDNYIVRSVEAIEENRDAEAIQLYTRMTNLLINFYNIDINNIVMPNVNEIDMNSLGHGRVRRRVLSSNNA